MNSLIDNNHNVNFSGAGIVWGLHYEGQVIKMLLWSNEIDPQELHFELKGEWWEHKKGRFSSINDFLYFGETKREVMKYKRKLIKSMT